MRICFRKKVLCVIFVFGVFQKLPTKNQVIPDKLAIAANIY